MLRKCERCESIRLDLVGADGNEELDSCLVSMYTYNLTKESVQYRTTRANMQWRRRPRECVTRANKLIVDFYLVVLSSSSSSSAIHYKPLREALRVVHSTL